MKALKKHLCPSEVSMIQALEDKDKLTQRTSIVTFTTWCSES